MNFERGYPPPVPKHGNGDIWNSVTRGMPILRESVIGRNQDSLTTTAGGNEETAEGQRKEVVNSKPEKVINEESNANPVGIQEKQPESDNWQNLVGMYTGLLKEEKVDRRSMKRKLNTIPCFKTDPANWKCNHLASIVCSKSLIEAQNNGVHLLNKPFVLQGKRNYTSKSTSTSLTSTHGSQQTQKFAFTSTFGSQQTQKFAFISNGHTSKDGATSSTITDSLQFAPITPAKHTYNLRVQNATPAKHTYNLRVPEDVMPAKHTYNLRVPENDTPAKHTYNLRVPEKVMPAKHTYNLRVSENVTPAEHTYNLRVPEHVTPAKHTYNLRVPEDITPAKQTYNLHEPENVTPAKHIYNLRVPKKVHFPTNENSPPSVVSTPQKVNLHVPEKVNIPTNENSPPSVVSTPQIVNLCLPEKVNIPTNENSPPSIVSTPQIVNLCLPEKVNIPTNENSPPSVVSTPQIVNLCVPEKVNIPTNENSPPCVVSTPQKVNLHVPEKFDILTDENSPPCVVSTPQKVNLCVPEKVNIPTNENSPPCVVSTPEKVNFPTNENSPPSVVSTPQKEQIVLEDKEEPVIDLSKTPQQKTPTRRKKHRPRVIKPQKPKKDPKDGSTPGEPRVKRKYVRRKGVGVSETQPKTPTPRVGKRKYVRKKSVDQVKSQQKSTVDNTPVKSCKKKLNFDLDINLNVNPQDTEQQKRIKRNKYTSLPVLNVPETKTAHVLNGYKMVPSNIQKVQQLNLPSINLDEKRGIKRQNSPMDSLYLYQKLLLGVAHRSHNHNIFLENHKKIKIHQETSRQMNGVYGNGSVVQLLHSSGQQVNPTNLINCQYPPQRLQFHNQIGWNQPLHIPPKEVLKYGVITYPATLLQKEGVLNGLKLEKEEVSVDYVTDKLARMRIYDDKRKEGNENEVVMYRGSDAIVPFEPIKKRIQRPKVDLDPDTDRLWKLLMGKEGESGETLDKDKEKWWENERRVFRGRADSFIARMHLVQGDRRFSRWKGSVVDSVIGVFLTQNVSDHLSSSAFMALAAKFPIKTSCEDSLESKDEIKCNENIKEPKTEKPIESTTIQNVDEIGSTLESNTEVEDLTTPQNGEKQEPPILEETPTKDEANSKEQNVSQEPQSETEAKTSKEKKRIAEEDERNIAMNWDSLRKEAMSNSEKREESKDARDSIDYEAFRHAPVNEISDAIKERGMNNMLAYRMQNFLNRLVRDHGKIDLEWLRDAPPDKAKEYLLSFRGLGLKSVECIRLLTLHHLAFPVDTNVGRIAVRLGWVPLQPLPESLQLHLLEMYPVLDSIQKYLWPRLCKLDQLTLYELHYQMITFGKVFCTKSKPNCNACPMRAECRHFASAFASARLALPSPEEKTIVTTNAPIPTNPIPHVVITPMPLGQGESKSEGCCGKNCEPIIEEPTTPEAENVTELSLSDIEEQYYEDSDEIPTIKLNMEEFTNNLQSIMQDSNGDMSKALVALNPKAAYIPIPKLKDVSRLRTEHQVYELPDSHRLLEGLEKREPDDPSPYLLAIWTPGETANSVQPPERECGAHEKGSLCDKTTCFACNSIKEANSQVVRGTILIPCRTAMRGSFPLNGTYFQVNEMFADHASSMKPIDVPRAWIWNLPRRTVYFGTSVSTIFRGLSTQGIQYCFWKGFVCVRGFDRETRAPRPLMARLHFPPSKLIKVKSEGK